MLDPNRRGGSAAFRLSLIMSGAILASVTGVPFATSAHAQGTQGVEAKRNYSIPAQPLAGALRQYMQQSGVQVGYPSDIGDNIVASALTGSFSSADALGRLLAGTGLTYRFTGAGTATLERAPQVADGTIQLGTLRIEGTNGNRGGVGANGDGDGIAAADLPFRTAGGSDHISLEKIERFRGTSPADIFKDTPGVISGESRNSGGIDVNIRGLQGYNRTTVTIDGAQQTSSMDRGYFGDANRTFIDPDLLSSVSISKGPSNSPSSSGAIAGEVAMTTLKAADIVREGRNFGIRARFGTSTNNTSLPPIGTEGGIGEFGGSYLTATNRPDLAVVSVPDDFGDTAAQGRPTWAEPHGWNGSVAIATQSDNLEFVAAIAHRDTGNYFAGSKGNYARVGQLFVTESSTPATASVIARLDRLAPGHGFVIGDILTQTRESYGNVGSTFYRAGEEVLNTSNIMTSGLLKGTIRFGDGHSVELGYNRSVSKFGYQFPSSLRFASSTNILSQMEPAEAQAEMATARYRFNPDDNALIDLSVNGWISGQTIDETMRSVGSTEVQFNENYSRTMGFDISNRSIIMTPLGEANLRYGVAYLHQKMRRDVDSQWMSGDVTVMRNISEINSNRHQFDLFLDADWALTDWIKLNTGLRYISARNSQIALPISSTEPTYPMETVRSSGSANGFAPSIGVMAEPLDGLQLYATYKQGWRAPSFTEVSDFQPGSTPYIYAPYDGPTMGDGLKNEISKNLELGFNYTNYDVLRDGDNVSLKVNYFRNNVHDYIVTELRSYEVDVGGTMQPRTGAVTTNYDSAEFAGFEGLLRYDAGVFFVEAGATYYDRVRICLSESVCRDWGLAQGISTNAWRNHIPPPYQISGTLGVRLLDDRLVIASRLGHTAGSKSRQLHTYQSTTNYISNLSWDAYTLVDLSASFEFSDAVRLDVAAENLFDKYHVDPLAMALQPAPGRTLRANLTLRF